jgi:hypothetical protein
VHVLLAADLGTKHALDAHDNHHCRLHSPRDPLPKQGYGHLHGTGKQTLMD